MIEVLFILLSATLYRIPRGGPDGHVWKRWVGFEPGSTLSSAVWAISTGLFLALITSPWALLFIPILFLGEAPGYMKYVKLDGVDSWRMNLRGCLLLNPFMGFIYAGCQKVTWPRFGNLMDGWTAYAELFCGIVTATSVLSVMKFVEHLN